MFLQFLLYRKVTQPHTHTTLSLSLSLFILSSVTSVAFKRLEVVAGAVQQDLTAYPCDV